MPLQVSGGSLVRDGDFHVSHLSRENDEIPWGAFGRAPVTRPIFRSYPRAQPPVVVLLPAEALAV